MGEFLLQWDNNKILNHFEDNEFLVKTANEQRLRLFSSPEQSEFRVYCLLIVKVKDSLIIIEGSNAEQGYIGGINGIIELYFLSMLLVYYYYRCDLCRKGGISAVAYVRFTIYYEARCRHC